MEDDTRLSIVPVSSLALAAAKSDNELVDMGTYRGMKGSYQLFGFKTDGEPAPLVETRFYRLYVLRHPGGQLGLMKISTSQEGAEALAKEARVLTTLAEIAKDVDLVGANYTAFFPALAETIRPDTGPDTGEVVLLLGYDPAIRAYTQLEPVSVVTHELRVDLQTTVWMLGKLLKILGYAHSLDFTNGSVNASNVLIETDLHGVFLLDWTLSNEAPLASETVGEVVSAAKIAWQAAGGTDTTPPPYDKEVMNEEGYNSFVAFVRSLMAGETDAAVAMTQLYKLADTIWAKESKAKEDGSGSVQKRPFHPFSLYDKVVVHA